MRTLRMVIIVLIAASVSLASPRVIEMDDKEGEPYKEAARVLLRAMIKGDDKAAHAAFVGEGDDLKLMELTLASNNAAKRVNDAVKAKFKDAGEAFNEDLLMPQLRVVDIQTIIVNSDRPDEASISPGEFPCVGYELKRREGKSLVRSITVFPEDIPAMLAVHPKLTAAFEDLEKRVKAGEFKSAGEVSDFGHTHIGPIFDEYMEKTRKGAPATQSAK